MTIINAWLRSIPEAHQIVLDFQRELGEGVIIGESKTVTRASLEKRKIDASDNDKKILLCWKLFQEIYTYFQEKNVNEPEKAASSLLTVSTQIHPSFMFFQMLGYMTGHDLFISNDKSRKYTFFYDKKTSTPCVRFQYAYLDKSKEKKFLVVNTMRVQENQGTFTEELTSTPTETPST